MASRPTKGNPQKLNRTLKELENAFADWESLGARKAKHPAGDVPEENDDHAEERKRQKAQEKAQEQSTKDFQKRTQALLDQLREQIAELAD